MLNWIWMGMVVVSVLVGGLMGTLGGEGGVVAGALNRAKAAVMEQALPLGAVMILWLGILRLAEASGAVAIIARGLRPVMRRLFPEVPPDHPAMGSMVMNFAANMLGMGNAATPLGLRAMSQLQELNPRKDTATDAMCTFLAINTSSVTLVPATAIALLVGAGMAAPYAILGPAIAATACSTAVAIVAVKFFARLPVFRSAPGCAAAPEAESAAVAAEAGGESAEDGPAQPRPIGTGGALALAAVALAAAGILVLELAPGWRDSFKSATGLAQVEALAGAKREAGAAVEAAAKAVEAGGVGEGEPVWRRAIGAVSVTVIPCFFLGFISFAAVRGVKVYEVFIEGAKEGFDVALRIMPYLVAMLVALGMLRDSGVLMLVQWILAPVLGAVGFPVDLLPLALMRPLSGSGSLGVLGEIVATEGLADWVKYTAATMYGSTETTFYVLAVYFGSVAVRKTRHALAAGLVADAAGIVAAVAIGRLFFAV